MKVYFQNKCIEELSDSNSITSVAEHLGLNFGEYYLLSNGKRVILGAIAGDAPVHIVPRLVGGKGGFGSMLRAIGAQIEKTTNREACRDLSGRRLRDINEEQRLKNWINTQPEREKEAAVKKQKKLEKLCEKPRHEFKDETYDLERSELPEKVEDAVLQGLKATGSKRKIEVPQKDKRKRAKLWIDEDISESEETDDSEEESLEPQTDKLVVAQ